MSPFALKMKEYRLQRKLRQNEAAEAIGCEQSYLSALESGHKGPPKDSFISRVIKAYKLSDLEIAALRQAIETSRRRFVLSPKATLDEYKIWTMLETQAGHMLPEQITLMKIALDLGRDECRITRT